MCTHDLGSANHNYGDFGRLASDVRRLLHELTSSQPIEASADL
jgi:hypothetical protein